MEKIVIHKQDQKTSEWSGGSTTELYLFPPDASYAERNFLFRISTAICRDEESVFTRLPDTVRILMLLHGNLSLSHDGGEWICLKSGEQDTFDGGVMTCSKGKCTDFNLMLKRGTGGEVMMLYLAENDSFTGAMKQEYIGVYLMDGVLELCSENTVELQPGDFCMLHGREASERWCIRAEKECHVVVAYINIAHAK